MFRNATSQVENAIPDYTAHHGRGILGYQICVRYSTSLKMDEDLLLNYDHFLGKLLVNL